MAATRALAVSLLAGSACAAEPIGLLTIRGVADWRARLTLRQAELPGGVAPGNRPLALPTVGAEITTRLSRNARLTFDVSNVLDRRAENLTTFPIIPSEPRAAHIRLRIAF